MELVALDSNAKEPMKLGTVSPNPGTASLYSRLKRRIVDYLIVGFLPKNYPESVTASYLPFSLWNLLANITGTLCGVLSLQALLQAVGMGAGSVPMAAGISWILKGEGERSETVVLFRLL